MPPVRSGNHGELSSTSLHPTPPALSEPKGGGLPGAEGHGGGGGSKVGKKSWKIRKSKMCSFHTYFDSPQQSQHLSTDTEGSEGSEGSEGQGP